MFNTNPMTAMLLICASFWLIAVVLGQILDWWQDRRAMIKEPTYYGQFDSLKKLLPRYWCAYVGGSDGEFFLSVYGHHKTDWNRKPHYYRVHDLNNGSYRLEYELYGTRAYTVVVGDEVTAAAMVALYSEQERQQIAV